MSVEKAGSGTAANTPEHRRDQRRRRWRTLQNRIERARRLRHAGPAASPGSRASREDGAGKA